MGRIPCEECHGDCYVKNERFERTETCPRCHGEGTNACPHDNTRPHYKDFNMYLKCVECGDQWEVIR